MKTINKVLTKTLLIGLLSISIACVDKKKENNTEAETHHEQDMHHDGEMEHGAEMDHDGDMHSDAGDASMSDSSAMDSQTSNGSSVIVDKYLAIKNALVNDDQNSAASAAEALVQSVNSFDVAQMEASKQEDLKQVLVAIETHGKQIKTSDIKLQRAAFAELNSVMKEALAITGTSRPLYEQYCPMYNQNEGGAWLSASKEVKNPLFGSQMLKCGSVKQTIAAQ